MGTHVLVLVLGCWVLGLCGASGSPGHPQLKPLAGHWVSVGAPLGLQCLGPGPLFLLLHGNRSEPVATIRSNSGLVTFSHIINATDTGLYTCHCRDLAGPSSNAVEVVVTDPRLEPPKLSLGPRQPLPAPRGTNVSVVCEGPPGAATFRLYREGPGGAVGQRWVAGGGAVPFSLGPLCPDDEGAYVCTYSPDGGGVSGPSPLLLLLVEGGDAIPKSPHWAGCQYWEGSN